MTKLKAKKVITQKYIFIYRKKKDIILLPL
jgi:hypothetical protein